MKTGRAVELEPLDRLEDKVRALVGAVEKLKADRAEALEQNARLAVDVEALQTRLAEAENANTEIMALRQERDQVRARVAELLDQLEALGLE